MKTTCGIFLINKHKQILICHPTNEHPQKWNIPKGIKDSCETDLNAAWREVTEETGIHRDDVIRRGHRFKRAMLGEAFYQEKPKRIVAYAYIFDGELDNELVCDSTFYCTYEKRRLPEVDRFRWLHYEHAAKYLNSSQQELLVNAIKLGLFK